MHVHTLRLLLAGGIALLPWAAQAQVGTLVSPDGAHIVYRVAGYSDEGDEITRIMVCDADGSRVREVAAFRGESSGLWWVGNDRLYLLRCNDDDLLGIAVITLSGEKWEDLPFPTGCEGYGPTLSPDAKRLAYYGEVRRLVGDPEYGIVVVDLAARTARCMLPGPYKNSPAWSPDGRTLAAGRGGYQRDYPLVLLDVETGAVREPGVLGVGAAWSPDGGSLALVTDVVAGGSWSAGIPRDGRIGLLDLASGQVSPITPEPVTNGEAAEGEIARRGCLNPQWAPDGKSLLYRQAVSTRKGDDTEDVEELWVVGRDGQGARRLSEGFGWPLTWTPDSRAILSLSTGSREIARIDVATGQRTVVATWPKPEPPDLGPAEPITVEAPGVRVELSHIERAYGEAFAAIIGEARNEYANVLRLPMPELLTLEATLDPKGRCRLWTDGATHFFLTVSKKAQLGPPSQGGVHNVYGMCHEMGHIAMYSRLDDLAGLPQGIGEGWAHYCGSVVVDEVAKRLGEGIWPEPYDVHAEDGLGRLEAQLKDKPIESLEGSQAGAKLFYEVELRHGREAVGKAMALALERSKAAIDLMPGFVQALREQTGQPTAGSWIPTALLEPRTEWSTQDKAPADAFFADQRAEADATGTLLAYDDGTSTGMRSMAGSGHAVLFRKPAGEWAVDRVLLYGSRYGPAEAPDKPFRVYLCDAEFRPFAEVKRPQGFFERTEPRWYEVTLDAPVTVPERFYVCFAFNPTQTDGVFVHYAAAPVRSHSRFALPYSHVGDLKEPADWMIRAHLAPAQPGQ